MKQDPTALEFHQGFRNGNRKFGPYGRFPTPMGVAHFPSQCLLIGACWHSSLLRRDPFFFPFCFHVKNQALTSEICAQNLRDPTNQRWLAHIPKKILHSRTLHNHCHLLFYIPPTTMINSCHSINGFANRDLFTNLETYIFIPCAKKCQMTK